MIALIGYLHSSFNTFQLQLEVRLIRFSEVGFKLLICGLGCLLARVLVSLLNLVNSVHGMSHCENHNVEFGPGREDNEKAYVD